MDWSIQTVYIGCAVAGGVVLLIQTVLLFTGGGDHDVPHVDAAPDIGVSDSGEPTGHDTGFGLISIRSVAAFLCFFGLTGMFGAARGWSSIATLGSATGAGIVMLVFVAWLFSLQRALYAQGNLEPKNAVGRVARVYLKIPGQNAGKGKITVSIQGRTTEYAASTKGAEIATGAEVKIVRQITEDTFEVEPA
ncbi:MAG: hypothetical protein IPJ77_11945 [Planctomycetes bacterium]|nr:hypothetical protein [Planctomycetota bacterium]